jgi:hypothetical protein
MKNLFNYIAAVLVIYTTSCNKNGNKVTLPTVSTTAVTSITYNAASGGGNVSSEGSSAVIDRGVCWNTSPNPTVSNNASSAGSGGSGMFTSSIGGLAPSTVYYVRAYATNAGGTSYGNEVSFTTIAAPVISANTVLATDIITKSATLKGTSIQPAGTSVVHRGFCCSTTPNPTISSPFVVTATTGGAGDYSMTISSLQPNTIYYYKAYVESATQVIYGNELSFKTTGYFGASGGYVFYDKGEVTNGWRYLEAAPAEVHYNITFSPGSKWGCVGQNLTLTYPDLGTGLENTNRIVSSCGNADCAARLCANYSVSGITGWFLPSRDEAFLLLRSLNPLSVLPPFYPYWTSSELTLNEATAIDYNLATSSFITTSINKDWYRTVRPVRRF